MYDYVLSIVTTTVLGPRNGVHFKSVCLCGVCFKFQVQPPPVALSAAANSFYYFKSIDCLRDWELDRRFTYSSLDVGHRSRHRRRRRTSKLLSWQLEYFVGGHCQLCTFPDFLPVQQVQPIADSTYPDFRGVWKKGFIEMTWISFVRSCNCSAFIK